MATDNLRARLRSALGSGPARDELISTIGGGVPYATHWYVNAQNGSNTNEGKSTDTAFATMTKALSVVGAGDVIHLRGPIFENCVAPAVAGVTIMGDGTGLRHGSLSNTSEGYAPAWRTGSGVTASPLLSISCQGWTVRDILMAGPSADACIHLETEGAATPEKTLSGLRVLGCRFQAGKYAIDDDGGAGYITIAGNSFEGQTTASIIHRNGESLPRGWRIIGNDFCEGSATHIDVPLVQSVIKDNVFGTVASTALYIDLTGGNNNNVVGNYLAGVYTTADYVAGTTDLWLGNWVTVISTQAPNGFTILAPAA